MPLEVLATTIATTTEAELVQVEARRAELLAKKAIEDAARDAAPLRVRTLAVRLHSRMCVSSHTGLDCTWGSDGGAAPDDPEKADWSEAQHRRWLTIATVGLEELAAVDAVAPPAVR